MALALSDLTDQERARLYPQFVTDLYHSSLEGRTLVVDALDREFLNPTATDAMAHSRATRIVTHSPDRLPLSRQFQGWLTDKNHDDLN